jgi:ribosomal protein S18 acetylase RimI-like enzyme
MRARQIESLSSAFEDDPVMRYLIPDQRVRVKALPLLMTFFIALSDFSGYLESEGDEAAGVQICFPPGKYPIFFLRMLPAIIRYSIPAFRVGIRPGIIIRALRFLWQIERLHPREPHWYVLIIGVNARRQGLGIGAKVMAPLLARADQNREAVYLESSNRRNIDFYERQMFKLLNEIQPLPDSPPMWRMLRPATGG